MGGCNSTPVVDFTESPNIKNLFTPESTNETNKYIMIYDKAPTLSRERIIEHYTPYCHPLCPVITSESQNLVINSWKTIVATDHDTEPIFGVVGNNKMSGSCFFYTTFFDQLFARLSDFARIFPNIKSRADIISHVMAMIVSIRVENLEFTKLRLTSLGEKHINIVLDPWLFGIYVTTIHSTVRACLQDDATPSVMNAWLHTLAFIIQNMLPSYFGDCVRFKRWYEGATNAASAIVDNGEISDVQNIKELKSSAQRSRHQSIPTTAQPRDKVSQISQIRPQGSPNNLKSGKPEEGFFENSASLVPKGFQKSGKPDVDSTVFRISTPVQDENIVERINMD